MIIIYAFYKETITRTKRKIQKTKNKFRNDSIGNEETDHKIAIKH